MTRNVGNTTGGIYVVADQDDDCAVGEEQSDPEGIPLEPSLDPAEAETTPFAKVRNSILYGNICRSSPICDNFERELKVSAFGLLIVDFNDLFDLAGSPFDTGGDSNIDTNPQFRDPNYSNFRLVETSPCVDIGNTRILPYDEEDIDADARTVCTGCANNVGEYAPDLDLRRRVVDTVSAADGPKSALSCFEECEKLVDLGTYEFACPTNCGPNGDLNDDGNVDGLDIQPFTWCAVQPENGSIPCLCADFSGPNDGMPDGNVDIYDVPCFIQLLLTGTMSCSGPLPCGAPQPEIVDCNDNNIPDANDIAFGASLDCNRNGVPDECDLSSEFSTDVNSNGIPDECETDCDINTIPDEWEIAQDSSKDINANGILDICEPDCDANGRPDDYDVAHGAADCNANGVPDSCEWDCNSNGVPDDCDIDPLDPDGDESVSEDCNENGIPDECDLARSILPSFDCNDNNVPDECDIASSTSEDANENGIPDECEREGRSMTEGGQGGEFEAEATWNTFYEWLDQQVFGDPGDWHTLTGPQRFERVMDELELLGLPIARPW